MNKRRNKLGFTLAELLIVVAIIGVLVAIAIPVFTSSLEKAREATCLSNRTSLQHMLIYGAMLDKDAFANIKDGDDWEKVQPILEATGNSFTDKICPSNGHITINRSDNSFTVTCGTHHDQNVADPPQLTTSNGLYKDFLTYIDEHGSDKNNNNYNNSMMRNNYWAANGNKWPTMLVNGNTYQIEPYYYKDTKHTILIARAGDGTITGNSFYVPMIYDPTTSTWYQHLGYNKKPDSSSEFMQLDTIDKLQQAVQDENKWEKVKLT